MYFRFFVYIFNRFCIVMVTIFVFVSKNHADADTEV